MFSATAVFFLCELSFYDIGTHVSPNCSLQCRKLWRRRRCCIRNSIYPKQVTGVLGTVQQVTYLGKKIVTDCYADPLFSVISESLTRISYTIGKCQFKSALLICKPVLGQWLGQQDKVIELKNNRRARSPATCRKRPLKVSVVLSRKVTFNSVGLVY